jgi:hypothetical protein
VDIYEQSPCGGEFLKLMEEVGAAGFSPLYRITYLRFQTLKNNLNWLLSHGFIQLKEEDVVLWKGMRVEAPDGSKYTVISSTKGTTLFLGSDNVAYHFTDGTTLKDLCRDTNSTFKVVND